MAEDRRLDGVVVSAGGSALPAEVHELLTLVRVEESVQLPDAFSLRFDDPHFALFDDDRFTLGTRIEIAFRAEGDLVVVTSGEVTAISVEPGAGGRHELVLSGLDVSHRLTRGPRTRSFLQVTDADIVGRIAGDHGLDADIDATREVHPYVLQTAESDYAFVARRARRIGFDAWVADRTLSFKQKPRSPVTPPALRWGENLTAFRVRFASAERCDEVTVRGWDPVAKQTVIGRAGTPDYGTTAPAAEEMARAARSAFGQTSREAGQFPVTTQAEADALAGSLLLRTSGGEVVARGEATGDPLLAAGAEVTIERVGSRLSGRYRLTSVEHVYGTGAPYTTRFVCGGKEPAALVDLLGGGGAADLGRAWSNLVPAIVTNSDDPLRLGRVKVLLPTLSGQDESTWARLVAPGAGPRRGLQCVPEVGDEVLVGFGNGDLHDPLVLGGLWNRSDAPPESEAVKGGEVGTRVWRSRNGHHLAFTDDRTGEIALGLGDAESSLILTRADSTLAGERTLTVKGQQVEVRADRKLVLSAPQIEITADAEVKVSGAMIRLN